MAEHPTSSPPDSCEPSLWPPADHSQVMLRAELEATTSGAARALLAIELGFACESDADFNQAVTAYQLARKEAPDAALPVERLIHLARHGIPVEDMSDLAAGRVHSSDLPEPRAAALLDLATLISDHEHRMQDALELMIQAAELQPNSPTLWLSIELTAAGVADEELRIRALSKRAELATDVAWKGLLLKDLAALQVAGGQLVDALSSLKAAIDQASPVTFYALRALESVGRQIQDFSVVVRALDAQAQLIMRALRDPKQAESLGVPRHRLNQVEASACWLWASDYALREGDAGEAARMIDQALEVLPNAPLLLQAKLSIADRAGDTEGAATAARMQLEGLSNGKLAAGLWLRIAEFAADRGDGDAALEAVEQALNADPQCIPAQALKLDLLSGREHSEALASALEEIAELVGSDEAKSHLYLLAAETWALGCGDTAGAKAALTQCSLLGIDPLVLARIARWLASAAGDSTWFEESTRRVLAAATDRSEVASLSFEHARSRLLRHDPSAAAEALDRLAQTGETGQALAALLKAWALPLCGPRTSTADAPTQTATDATTAAMGELAARAATPATARALRLAQVVRSLTTGQTGLAAEQLTALRESHPDDFVISVAVSALAERTGDRLLAASSLLDSAELVNDDPLATHLRLRASLLFWSGGDKSGASRALRAAYDHSPASVDPLLRAVLARFPSDAIDERREALLAPSSNQPDGAWLALRRFALELTRDDAANAAGRALPDPRIGETKELATAVRLALAVAPHAATGSANAGIEALMLLAEAAPEVAPLAAARAYFLSLTNETEPAAKLALAKRWASLQPGIPSALEWLSAATAANAEEEILLSREMLAAQLGPCQAAELRADTAILQHLTIGQPHTPLQGDDASTRLMNLELALPGEPASHRAHALAGAPGLFDNDSDPVISTMLGYNALVLGDTSGALAAFRHATEANPRDAAAWEGVRACALSMQDDALLGDAYASLGEATAEPELRAAMWENAALIWLDSIDDTTRGEFALQRSLELDIRRSVAFDRLFRILRKGKKDSRLLPLIERRLTVSDDLEEIVKLHWERARALRELGDRDGALAALADVRMLESDHVGALALAGEILIKEARFDEAAVALGQLAQLDGVPQNQRLMSGIAAVDLYENKLNKLDSALAILATLHDAGLTTLPVRERLARLAAKAEAWEQAGGVLQELMNERETREGRVEAARLALAIYRDKLSQPAQCLPPLSRLIAEAPDDPEGIDFMLSGAIERYHLVDLLQQAKTALFFELQRDPMDAERIDRLARLATELESVPLRQATLGALVALGAGTPEIDAELYALDERVARLPRIAIDPASVPELLDPGDGGPIAELFREIAAGLTDALGPTLKGLGLTKKQRLDPRDGAPLRTTVAAWAGALGIGDFDLYVGGAEPDEVRGIPGEKPTIVIGSAVQAPLSPRHRQAVARELYAIVRGTAILRARSASDLAALVHAACSVGGHALPGPSYALIPEFERLLSRELPRRYRKRLPELTEAIAVRGQDVTEWVRSANASLDRVATLAAGDVSWILAEGPKRGQLGASLEARRRAQRLLGFVLSKSYLDLRDKLGMGIR